MEAEKTLRRRLSASSNLNISNTDNHNTFSEEESELLIDRESYDGARGSQEAITLNASCEDLSSWARPLGFCFAALFLIVILSKASVVFHSWFDNSVTIKMASGGAIGMKERDPILGIQLFPQLHNSRPPKTITHFWNISSGIRWPDGVKKEVYLVNELFPGPTIECRSGDKLVIHVTNNLSSKEGLSIHWHGLKMRGANHMDGAVGFTQCPIGVGRTFTYEFMIGNDESGTFWWHAHSQVQRGDGMYGGLVVHTPLDQIKAISNHPYEKEILLLVGDWYHRTSNEVLEWYTSVRGFGNEPVPDSLLVNGEGRFVCSMAVPARPVECLDIPETSMRRILGSNITTQLRLRVVNVGSLAGFTISVDSGTLLPLEIDGGFPISGNTSNSVGVLYPGERVDMLLVWRDGSPVVTSKLNVILDPTNFKYPNQALRANQTFPMFTPTISNSLGKTTSNSMEAHFDLSVAKAANVSFTLPISQNTILLYTKTQKLSISSNHPTGYINRTTWSPQTPPLLSLPRPEWDTNQLIPYILEDTWTEIILNNLDDDAHPFHLHGNSFYVMASHRSKHGWGSYNPYSTISKFPMLNQSPVRRDTVTVPRRGHVVLLFKADNVGLWMLHCHILFHQASGMAMGLHVGQDKRHLNINAKSADLCSGNS